MYLHCLDIHCCRYFFWDRCICNLLFFKLADAFQPTHHVNCICILPYLGFKDTSFANFTSTSHVFDNVRMLLIEILHPQLVLSMLCGYSSSTFCIFNSRKPIITDIAAQYPLSSIYFTTWANTLLTKNWYKKFERIWSERWRHLERKFLY